MLEKCENSIIDEELLGMKKEDMEVVDLDHCEVVRKQYLAHTRDTLLTIKPDGIQFNNTCISRMPGAEYVLLFVDKEKQRLYVTACDRDDRNSQKWCNVKDGIRKSRKIRGILLGDRIYDLMKWSKGYSFKICGYPAKRENDTDRLVMVFDFAEAEKIPLTRKQRVSAGVEPEDLTVEEVAELDRIEDARIKAKESGRKSTYQRLGVSFSEEWTKDSFGEQVKDYESRPIIPTWDDLENGATVLESSDVKPAAPAPQPVYQQNSFFGYDGGGYGQSRSSLSV